MRAIEDPKAIEALLKSGVVLEICPTSNILAGIYPSYDKHPLRKLYDAGVKITLNSDDPGLFGCSIGSEYQVAKDHFGFSDEELLDATRVAVESAYVDGPTRTKLRQKVDDFSFFLKARRQNNNRAPGLKPPRP